MAYKILGQTISVAPSTASSTINLIKDSSFDLAAGTSSFTTQLNTAGASSTRTESINGSTNWYTSNATTTEFYVTTAGARGVSAPFGNSNTAIGIYFTGGGSPSAYLGYGHSASTSIGIANTTLASTANAIPVVSGSTYYFGQSLYTPDTSNTSIDAFVRWYTSAGTYISQTSLTSTRSNGTWTRSTSSVTAASGSALAVLGWEFYFATSNRYTLVDGVTFAATSTLQTTFTQPLLPSEAATTSPFDKKTNGYSLETPSSISTLSYAGPIQTLYTCPAGSSSVVSTITASNLTGNATSFRLIVQKSGDSLATKHFIALDQTISANATEAYTIGITLSAGDILKVAADTSTVSFSAFGSEN
jgi:hypothetical protein